MSLRGEKLREAYELLRRDRAEKRKARPKIIPVAKGQREVRQRDNGYLAYLRRQPCEARHLGGCGGPADPAHVRYNGGPDRQNPGAGRKNHDRHCNPLCRNHHEQQHHAGDEQRFWRTVGKNAYDTAAGHYAKYLAGESGALVPQTANPAEPLNTNKNPL